MAKRVIIVVVVVVIVVAVVMVNELLSYCEDSEDSPLEENGDCN